MYNGDTCFSRRRLRAAIGEIMGDGVRDIKRKLNDFLISEFGIDSDGGTRSGTDSWPFVLMPVGRITPGPGEPDIFRFELEEPYFVLDIGQPHCYPVAGMTLADLKRQFTGASWLSTQEPIDLSTSATGLLGVPSIPERRQFITSLVTSALGSEASFKILECLYLRKSNRYYSLVEMADSAELDGFIASAPSSLSAVACRVSAGKSLPDSQFATRPKRPPLAYRRRRQRHSRKGLGRVEYYHPEG